MKAKLLSIFALLGSTIFLVTLIYFFIFSGSPDLDSVIRIGRDPLWSSIAMPDKARQFLAFTDDLVVEIAKREDLQIQFMDDSTSDLFPLLRRREVTGIIAVGLPPPPWKAQDYYYSDSIYDIGIVLVTRANSSVHQLSDAKGRVIGMLHNAVAASQLHIDPTIFVVNFDSPLTLIGRLTDGVIDAALMPYLQAYSLSQGLFKEQIRISSIPVIADDVRLAVRRSSEGQALIDRFNSALKNIKEDGTYEKLLDRWGVPDPQKLRTRTAPE